MGKDRKSNPRCEGQFGVARTTGGQTISTGWRRLLPSAERIVKIRCVTIERNCIFVSYRSEDSDYAARTLAENLRQHFGDERVFHDIASILPGTHFDVAIVDGLARCAAVLVLIGPNWASMKDSGQRRIDNLDDWVRREVAMSLSETQIRIFPLLVSNARMPDAEELPNDLRGLPQWQAYELTTRHWAQDVQKLIAHLEKIPNLAPTRTSHDQGSEGPKLVKEYPRRRIALWFGITACLLVIGLAASTVWGPWTLHEQGPSRERISHAPEHATTQSPQLEHKSGLDPTSLGALSQDQQRRIRQLITLFETGNIVPDFTRIDGVSGHGRGLAFGIVPSTLASGALGALVSDYVKAENAIYAEDLRPFLDRLARGDESLNSDVSFHEQLRRSGRDPVMQGLQDIRSLDTFFRPAVRIAAQHGIRTALGIAVVIDSYIHGGWQRIRDRAVKKTGGTPESGVSEGVWIKTYLEERRNWLMSQSSLALRETANRPEAFLDLVAAGNWELEPPIEVKIQVD